MPNGQQTPTALGVTENLGGALAYLLGPITGILFLLIEKNNQFVRFHAMQSTILWVAMFILSSVLGIIPILGWLVLLLLIPFQIILWLFLMYKGYSHEWYKLPIVGDIAEQQMGAIGGAAAPQQGYQQPQQGYQQPQQGYQQPFQQGQQPPQQGQEPYYQG
ncbi:MAG: hypothetical protein QF415_13910 [Candidatus Undinarchaeales archaeon]|nr:hypothetical protein [Candidatus Undinarchaeales archaeon]